jgi:hypothetical protein
MSITVARNTPVRSFESEAPSRDLLHGAVSSVDAPDLKHYDQSVNQTPVAALLASSFRRLEKLKALEHDWDSYGGVPPTVAAISTADRLLQQVSERFEWTASMSIAPYAVAPVSGGGVQIEWRSLTTAIEVEIDSEGKLGYLLVQGSGEGRTYEEEENVSESRILQLVSKVLVADFQA